MSAALPSPVVPLIMVVPAPSQQQVSPRQLRLEVDRLASTVEQLKTYCKPFGDELNRSAISLEQTAVIFERLGRYEQERAKQEEQCQQLQTLLQGLKREMEAVNHQLDEATAATHTSEQEKKRLLQALENQKAELGAARKAVKGWEAAFLKADSEREEEVRKHNDAEERVRHKAAEALVLQQDLQMNRDVNALLVGRLRDRVQENQAMQALNQALQAEMDLHRQEKANLELAARQQKVVLQQKEQNIQAQGQRIQGLEGRIKDQKGDLAQVQKQVAALKDGMKNQGVQKASERMQRISRIAIAVLIALGIALSIALIIWLSPSMAATSGSLVGRGVLAGPALV